MKTKGALLAAAAFAVVMLIGLADAGRNGQSGRGSGRGKSNRNETCTLPSEVGMCRASMPRWYYDSTDGECKVFQYGGCGGNSNNFDTQGHCERRCKRPTAAARPGAVARTAEAGGWCKSSPCTKTCLHGFMTEASGCKLCACSPNPNAVNCPIIDECPGTSCPHGYQEDESGCMTCTCRPRGGRTRSRVERSSEPAKGTLQCSNAACYKECENGFQKDSFGCDLCICATRRSRHHITRQHHHRGAANCSDQAICRMHCEHGFVKGPDGCDVCTCANATVGHHDRRGGAQRGYHHRKHGGNETDPSGSNVDCSELRSCRRHCEHGFLKDSFGCDVCQCSSHHTDASVGHHRFRGHHHGKPAQIPTNGTAPGAPAQIPATAGVRAQQRPVNVDCSELRSCRRHCEHGFLKDTFGCDICQCSTRRQLACGRQPQCAMHCPSGFKRGADGCATCTCNDAPAAVPAPAAPGVTRNTACDNRPMCTMYCSNGFKKGADGCPVCSCA